MNLILLILILIILLGGKTKELFTSKECNTCRRKIARDKRLAGEAINRDEIWNECIKDGDDDENYCSNDDHCHDCVVSDKKNDPNLIKVIDGYDIKVDLNKCNKFRKCHDNFSNGKCNNKKWRKEGSERYCCGPCIDALKKGTDEPDWTSYNFAKECRNNLKLDGVGVCTDRTLNYLKNRQKIMKAKRVDRRYKQVKRNVKKAKERADKETERRKMKETERREMKEIS